jgi:hypothetical protein
MPLIEYEPVIKKDQSSLLKLDKYFQNSPTDKEKETKKPQPTRTIVLTRTDKSKT